MLVIIVYYGNIIINEFFLWHYHMVLIHFYYVWNLQKNGQEAAVIESPPETLQSIGNLLGGPPGKYELSITNKITVRSNTVCHYS